ncbi:MAG: hypothetical protein KGY74_09950 [Candidatus Cloacimonetes bacterium]|nr:hypothetical protein [Candidatus Cloacimonadota bacterium]
MKNKENLILIDKITGNKPGRILTSITVLLILSSVIFLLIDESLQRALIQVFITGFLFLLFIPLTYFIIYITDQFTYFRKKHILKEKINNGNFPKYHDFIAITIGAIRLIIIALGSYSDIISNTKNLI